MNNLGLYFLFDHKSSPEEFVAYYLLRYIVKIWEKELAKKVKRLPVIIPSVFYHGKDNWNIGLRLKDILDCADESLLRYIPDFEYVLTDLSKYPDNRIKGDTKLKVGFRLFKHIFDRSKQFGRISLPVNEFIKKSRIRARWERFFGNLYKISLYNRSLTGYCF